MVPFNHLRSRTLLTHVKSLFVYFTNMGRSRQCGGRHKVAEATRHAAARVQRVRQGKDHHNKQGAAGSERNVTGSIVLWEETLALLVLSYQGTVWGLHCSRSFSLPLPLVSGALSVAVTANRHHQSHQLTEALTSNLATAVKATARACLANLLVHSTGKSTYLHAGAATCTRAHTETPKGRKHRQDSFITLPEPKQSAVCPDFYVPLFQCAAAGSSLTACLMFSMCAGLTAFIWDLKAHSAISPLSRMDWNSSVGHLGEL